MDKINIFLHRISIHLVLIWAMITSLPHTSAAQAQTVRINEFMASNTSTLADVDGDFSDWLELYNPAATAVNLAGWSLTDAMASPRKWTFPSVGLESDGYLVLFASGKDIASPDAELHTNFKLDAAGEYLALFDASGALVTEFAPAFPEQFADVSFCFMNGDYIASTSPTPGAANQFSAHDRLPLPQFSHVRGFYETPFDLRLTSSLSNAEIYYTLDGSEPTTETGTRYAQPISIAGTTVLRAIVSYDDMVSVSATHTYLFLNSVIAQPNNPPGYPQEWGPYTGIAGTAIADYEMDAEITGDPRYAPLIKDAFTSIPTISIVTRKENLFSHSKDPQSGGIYIYTGPPEGGDVPGLGDDWERPASVEFFTADKSEEFQLNCGVRLQGGHSRRPEKSPKHSFRIVFRSEYGPERLEYPLFGEEAAQSFNTITLRAGFGNEWIHWNDDERRRGNYGRDIWAKDAQLAMGHPAGHGRYAHLYINGLYWGLYNPTERLDREFAQSYLGGDDMDYDVIKDYTSVVDGDVTAWNEMMSLARRGLASTANYQRIQGNNPDGTPNPDYAPYVDVVSLADYMLLNFYGGNTDWDHHNWVAIRNRALPDKGFQFFSWDAEHVLKSVNENVTSENNANCPSDLFQRLCANSDFRRLFADRVQRHCFNGGVMTPEAAAARWQSRAQQIELAVVSESARWGDYRRDVHRYQAGDTFDLYDKQYWQDEQDYLLNDYFPARTSRLISQLRAAGLFPNVQAPQLLLNDQAIAGTIIKPGDVLSMTAPGSIYYTLDGTDPLHSQYVAPGVETILVVEHARKQVLVPKTDIGDSWRADVTYDDSSWRLCRGAPGGVGYEKESGYQDLISMDVGDDMHDDGGDPNPSCYVRIKFALSRDNLANIKSLKLNVRFDDGFVAFLNGARVAEANAPATIRWNSVASAGHEDAGAEAFDVSRFIDLLVEGDNLLAFQGLNTNTSSSDFLISAALMASDQASSGGIVSPNAILYEAPLVCTASTHIKARALSGSELSALNELMLVLPSDLYNVRLTEIHYHPLAQDTIENRSLEFIELKNIGNAPIDLSGVQFCRGLTYKFPMNTILHGGEFIVLASNSLQFHDRYGFAPYGSYDGFLANDGETVALINTSHDTLLSVRYDDKSPWPEEADGHGYSLVPIDLNPAADQNDPQQWRISLAIHGSPGRDDTPAAGAADAGKMPSEFQLINYPNPFNPGTTIEYAIRTRCHVTLTIYDILGREVVTLVDEIQAPDHYKLWFDAGRLASGVYFCRLRVGANDQKTKKMLLIR
ncbi:lamin tail domain-containing protein [candidate division KSB1 bacterium]|nr:lamin tail domain-containing protein [candidate division KSB1 bacterium]